MREPAGGWIPDPHWKEPSSIKGTVEECSSRLRDYIAQAAKEFKTLYGRELGSIEMTASTAEACGISAGVSGWGEFEGTQVHVRTSLRAPK